MPSEGESITNITETNRNENEQKSEGRIKEEGSKRDRDDAVAHVITKQIEASELREKHPSQCLMIHI